MRTPPPTVAPNKYNLHGRVEEVEVVAANALTEAKRAHERLDHQPPRGERGLTGVKGDRGKHGENGRDGKDSTVPGPSGASVVGPKGNTGDRGDRGPAGPVSAEVLAATRAELANVMKQFEDLKLVVDAIHSQNRQCDEYINFLRQKVAARRKS